MNNEIYNEKYNKHTTGNDILNDFKENVVNKLYVITGGTSGLGLECAKTLAKNNAKVVICGRSNYGYEIEKLYKNIHFIQTDLCSVNSVKEFCNSVKSLQWYIDNNNSIDCLMLNAGGNCMDGTAEDTNLSNMIMINHIAHFAILEKLKDDIQRSKDGRVVIVASRAHENITSINLKDIELPVLPGISFKQYFLCKAINVIFAMEAHRRYKHLFTVNSLHPARFRCKSVEEGISTQLRLAVDPTLRGNGGLYFVDCNPKQPTKLTCNSENGKELWNISEKIYNRFYN